LPLLTFSLSLADAQKPRATALQQVVKAADAIVAAVDSNALAGACVRARRARSCGAQT
jgi:hypothetical protein